MSDLDIEVDLSSREGFIKAMHESSPAMRGSYANFNWWCSYRSEIEDGKNGRYLWAN